MARRPGDGPADNMRARRYVAKYTIAPAVIEPLDDGTGVRSSRASPADLVPWSALFGVASTCGAGRPEHQRGVSMGDANSFDSDTASHSCRCRCSAPGSLPARLAWQLPMAAVEAGLADRWQSERPPAASKDVSQLSKATPA